MSKVAVFDIDGVLADFNDLLVELFGVGKGEHLYSIQERYSGETLVLAKAVEIDANYYYSLKPIRSGIGFVKDTLRRGYEVLFLTSRPDYGSIKNFTNRWLQKQLRIGGINYEDTLGCVFSTNKAVYLNKHKKDVAFFIDDNPESIEDAKLVGIPVFSWAQPWNEHVFPKLYPYSGEIAIQIDEYSDGQYFWNYIEEMK